MKDIIAPGTLLEQAASGFTFTEGPIWEEATQSLIFSDIAESIQYRWRADEGLSVFRRPSNQAIGNCFDGAGRIITCEHASSHLVIHDHGGKRVRVLASHFEGQELNSPNDVICDSQGRIWFTDPSFGRTREDLGLIRDQDLPFQGVFRLDPDGTLALVARDFKQPNGLCLSNDERQLFVNDSWGPTIRRFEVDDDGNWSIPHVYVAIDAGTVVNTDHVRAQCEGGSVYGLSCAIGAITATDGIVDQGNFIDYLVTRMNQAPATIDVHIVESDAPPAGVGEPPTPPFAPALANAIYEATGTRYRDLPIPLRVKRAS